MNKHAKFKYQQLSRGSIRLDIEDNHYELQKMRKKLVYGNQLSIRQTTNIFSLS